MKRSQGGSTITQQLARNIPGTHERTFTRKLKETVLAIELERNYTKDQILEMYFNQLLRGGRLRRGDRRQDLLQQAAARAELGRLRLAGRHSEPPSK